MRKPASVPPFLPDARALPTIECERVRLRWLTPDDVPALYAVFGDPDVCRYWSHVAFTGAAQASALHADVVRGFAARTLFQWGIALRDGDAVIGTCTLHRLCAEHRRAELGYALHRAHWGRGYAAEALPALLRFAFGTLGLHRLEADADPRNAPSVRALEGLGFRREGLQRERYHIHGEVQDALLFGLLRREWEARDGAPAPATA